MQVPFYREGPGFLFWIALAYLYLLAVEIYLVVGRREPATLVRERWRAAAEPDEGVRAEWNGRDTTRVTAASQLA